MLNRCYFFIIIRIIFNTYNVFVKLLIFPLKGLNFLLQIIDLALIILLFIKDILYLLFENGPFFLQKFDLALCLLQLVLFHLLLQDQQLLFLVESRDQLRVGLLIVSIFLLESDDIFLLGLNFLYFHDDFFILITDFVDEFIDMLIFSL
jgi:hypothetical protein